MDAKKLYVAIAGNIGVGKTTLTRLLSEKLAWKPYYEKVINNPYLPDFYNDMSRWSFHLQVYFLSSRFRNQKEINEWPSSCIQDRSIYEDVEIFARTLYKQGYMSQRDYDNYRDLFSIMVSYLRKPDLIIYLKAPIEKLVKHIRKRGRDYETHIDEAYLAALNDAYDAWIEEAQKEAMNVYIYDITHRDFEKNSEDLQIIYQLIRGMEKQSWLKNV